MALKLRVDAADPELEALLRYLNTLKLSSLELEDLLNRAKAWVCLSRNYSYHVRSNLPLVSVRLEVEGSALHLDSEYISGERQKVNAASQEPTSIPK